MKKTMLLFAALVLSAHVYAQKEDQKLKRKLLDLVKNFNGDVGIYVRHLNTGKTVSIQADSLFPTASMIKIPIAIGLFDRIEKGAIDYRTELIYRDSLLYEGEDILGSFKDYEKIWLSKVLMLMITTSDNTASLWCQSLADGGARINDLLDHYGFHNIRVNSRTPGREANREAFGWGQTTPKEMAELLVMIRQGKIVSERSSERIYRNVCRNYWDGEAVSQIPPSIHVASKQGAVDQSRSEVVLVHAPHGEYVFCVVTKNQKDQSWVKENEGFELIRKVSRLLWTTFEPDFKWEPSENIQEWW